MVSGHVPSPPSLGGVIVLYVLYGISTLLIVPAIFGEDSAGLVQIADALNTLLNLATLVAVFHFRTALHQLQRSHKGSPTWLSGPATFFFSVFYFQYKLNRGLITTRDED